MAAQMRMAATPRAEAPTVVRVRLRAIIGWAQGTGKGGVQEEQAEERCCSRCGGRGRCHGWMAPLLGACRGARQACTGGSRGGDQGRQQQQGDHRQYGAAVAALRGQQALPAAAVSHQDVAGDDCMCLWGVMVVMKKKRNKNGEKRKGRKRKEKMGARFSHPPSMIIMRPKQLTMTAKSSSA